MTQTVEREMRANLEKEIVRLKGQLARRAEKIRQLEADNLRLWDELSAEKERSASHQDTERP